MKIQETLNNLLFFPITPGNMWVQSSRLVSAFDCAEKSGDFWSHAAENLKDFGIFMLRLSSCSMDYCRSVDDDQ